jgi:hypothetical protein
MLQELEKGDKTAYYYSPEYCVPLLDYVEILAEEYNPVTQEDMECGYLVTKGVGTFLYRYFDGRIDKSFKQKFIDNKVVQETITALGYDVDKFWYLLLFVFDYSNGMCINGIVQNKSPKEHLKKISNAVFENLETFDENTNKISFKSSTKFILEIKGKHKISIDDPTTIYHLAELCLNDLDKITDGSLLSQSNTKVKTKNGKIIGETSSYSVHIWYFAKMFHSFFELNPPKKGHAKKGSTISMSKNSLISNLIIITGLSKNESFTISDETLKGFLKQYKGLNLNMANGFYL